ncbi:MAG: hypothetical protein SOZ58_11180 [Prevotella sp.]|nr:hypothetical protein [Prevotella sp.]
MTINSSKILSFLKVIGTILVSIAGAFTVVSCTMPGARIPVPWLY